MARQTSSRRRVKKPVSSGKRQRSTRAGQTVRPGMTSRNSERARRERLRRRRRNQLIFRVVCGLLICAAIVLAPTVFFRVSHVTVVGDTRYAEQDLIDTSGIQQGDNMFFLDFDHIAQTIQTNYPYIDTVELHRRLPSTLQIEVTERTAALSVEVDGEYLLMDLTGKVLEQIEQAADNTVEVIGAEAENLQTGDTIGEKQEKLQTVLDLMNLMIQYELNEKVDSIDISKAYDVRVRYDGRYTILLSDLSDLEHKIQFLQAILKESSLPETGIIDLTDDKKAHYRPDTSTGLQNEPEEETETDPEDGTEDTSGQDQDSPDDTAEPEEQTDTGTEEDADGENSGENSDEQTAAALRFGRIIL